MQIGDKVNILRKQENGTWLDIINGGLVVALSTSHAKVWDRNGEHSGSADNAEWFAINAPSCKVVVSP